MQRAGWTFVVATMMVLLRPAAAQRGPAAPGGGQAPAVAQAGEGGALYGRFCSPCHGAAGDGHGPARPWLAPLPRDLIRGPFKWRAAAGDILPDRADLRAAIDHGVPGTSMPGFADALDARQRELLVDVVLALASSLGASSPRARGRVELGPQPAPGDAGQLALGARLWHERACAVCHGARGRGDGPAALGLRDAAGLAAPPYDLSAGVRRPHDVMHPGAVRVAAARSIATGLPGTAMPAFTLPSGELWALAEYVASLRGPRAADGELPRLPDAAIAADRTAPTEAGVWPGRGDPAAEAVFGGVIAPQGPVPAALAPAQASLSWRQCARCHAAQAAQWRSSIHAAAYSPGLRAQLVRGGVADLSAAAISSCQRCHGPLAEQRERLAGADGRYVEHAGYSAELAAEGVTCASCHVRRWQRLGPPHIAPSLLPLPGYPRLEAAVYERADFCLPCHQLPARQAVAGRPLLDTYREWLQGPYMRRGVQCQHCHMPNREHSFRGIHDPDTVRQGVAVKLTASRSGTGVVTVRGVATNVGAGHYLPTTPTPALWLTLELLDDAGRPIKGAHSRTRIGRQLVFSGGAWRQEADTRIAPGAELSVVRAWRDGRVASARRARLALEVFPDDYYEGFYRAQLAAEKQPQARAHYQEALRRAIASRYLAVEQFVELGP